MSVRQQFIGLFVIVVLCLGAGGLGAIATTPEIDSWYKTINKPDWNPPNYVFGPVWSTLYLMLPVVSLVHGGLGHIGGVFFYEIAMGDDYKK